MDQITKFLDPIFNYLESGKLFRQPLAILYYLLGAATFGFGIYMCVKLFDNFSYMSGAYKVYAILMLIVFLGLCVFSLLFWIRKAGEVSTDFDEGSKFIAMPIVANLVRVFGEWFGFVFAIYSAVGGLLTLVFLSGENGGIGVGLAIMVGGCILAYLIFLFTRYISETIMIKVAIAKNTKDTVKAIENK